MTEPATVKVDEERALLWLSRGAQPTERVEKLLTRMGVTAKFQAEHPKRATGALAAPPPPAEAGESAPAAAE